MKKLLTLLILWMFLFPLSGQQIIRAEYFIDADPGYGKGIYIPVVPGANQEIILNIPVNDIYNGLHTLYVRARDDTRGWGQTLNQVFMVHRMPDETSANLHKVEYFVDSDPGYDKATAVNFQPGSDATVTFNLPLESLSLGIHNLFVRARDDYGWGATFNRYFLIQETSYLNRIEYFFDKDPGYGNGIPVEFLSAPNVAVELGIPLDTLSSGFHSLFVRGRDENGIWGQTFNRFFFVQWIKDEDLTSITGAEYFFDRDPGYGMGIPFNFKPGGNVIADLSLSLDTMSMGIHHLNVRARNDQGNWGQTFSHLFLINCVPDQTLTEISRVEYFIDTDPGYGQGNPIEFQPGAIITMDLSIPANTLSPGLHTLVVRAKNNNGFWGQCYNRIFMKQGGKDDIALITRIEYFVNEDPGFGKGNKVTINQPLEDIRKYFVVDPGLIRPGENTFYVRALDNLGRWSMVYSSVFNALSTGPCEAPKSLVASEVTENTANLGWTQNGIVTGWDILWAPSGFDYTEEGTLGTGITTNPQKIEGLARTKLYEFYVRSECSDGQVSPWAGPAVFHTLPLSVNPVSLLSDPPGSSVLTGHGNYTYGQAVTITAIPNTNFVFLYWAGDSSYLDNPTSDTANFMMPAVPVTMTAHFLDITNIAGTAEKSLRIFPNPANEQLYVEFYKPVGSEVQMQIFNIHGTICDQKIIDGTGMIRTNFQTGKLSPGIYILIIRGEKWNEKRKIIVER